MLSFKQLAEGRKYTGTYSVISHDVASREDDIPWHPKNYRVHGHKMDEKSAHDLAKKVRDTKSKYLWRKHEKKIFGFKDGNSYHIGHQDEDSAIHSTHVVKD